MLAAAAFALILVATGLVIYNQLQTELISRELDELTQRALDIAAGRMTQQEAAFRVSGPVLDGLAVDFATQTDKRVSLMLLDTAGAPLVAPVVQGSDFPASYSPIPYASLAAAGASETFILRASASGQHRTLVRLVPLTDAAGSSIGLAQMAVGLSPVDQALRRARILLVIAGAIAVAAAGAVMLIVADLGMRPLKRMSRQVRRSASGGFTERIARSPGEDEVAALSLAFNRAVDEIATRETELQWTRKQMRQLVLDVAHETRTPLTALNGYLDVLLGGLVSDRETNDRVLQSMKSEVVRLTKLISNLTTLSRMEAREGLSRQRVDLAAICYEAVTYLRGISAGRTITYDTNGDCSAMVDPERLKRVVANLLQNAVQHTAPGGTIGVTVGRHERECTIAVSDNGTGIPPEHVPHVFDPLNRADFDRARATGGAGLSLSIARAIVEAHDGRIELESAEGKGSTFTIHLPHAVT